MQIERALNEAASSANRVLDELIPAVDGAEGRVVEAMRYATMGGGKRIRPYLVLNSAALFNVNPGNALRAAAAVEMLHFRSEHPWRPRWRITRTPAARYRRRSRL